MDKWLLAALIGVGVNTLANVGEGIACGVINGKADSASITAQDAKAVGERNTMAIARLYQELGLVQQQQQNCQAPMQVQTPPPVQAPMQVQPAVDPNAAVITAIEKMTASFDKINDKLDKLSK